MGELDKEKLNMGEWIQNLTDFSEEQKNRLNELVNTSNLVSSLVRKYLELKEAKLASRIGDNDIITDDLIESDLPPEDKFLKVRLKDELNRISLT